MVQILAGMVHWIVVDFACFGLNNDATAITAESYSAWPLTQQ
jgi:hypothetical protein